MPAATAGGDAEIRVAGLARPVDDAAHHRHLQRDVARLECGLRRGGHLDHVDLGPPARRTRDQIDVAPFAQPERLEERAPRPRFLHRIRGQREADRVADALGQERPDAGGRLDQSGRWGTRLGHAQVQRMVDRLREHPVGLDHERHARGLHRDLHVVEVDLTEVVELLDRRGDQRLGGRTAEPLGDLGVEAAGVHPDPDRQTPVARRGGDLLDLRRLADVPRVEPERVHPGLDRGEGEPVVEVDVGDHRDRRTGHDVGQPFGGLLLVAGAPHDVASGGRQGVDLSQRALDVGGLGRRHRLHRHRCPAADEDTAHVHLAGGAPFDHPRNGTERRSRRTPLSGRGRAGRGASPRGRR